MSKHKGPRAKDYTGPRTLVLDVSHWQGDVDWQAVASDEKAPAAAIIRLGDGQTDDRKAAEYLRAAKHAGLLIGAYRYLRADHDLARHRESDHRVLEAAGVTLDLPLCPDLEGHPERGEREASGAWQDVSPTKDPDTAEVLERTHEYIEHARKLTGLQPWLYTGRAWLDHIRDPPAWSAQVPLWLAIGAGGRIPNPWQLSDVVLHQYSAKGSVRGIDGAVDLNWYHGEASALRASPPAAEPDGIDRVAALHALAEGAPDAEQVLLLQAARELGALRSC